VETVKQLKYLKIWKFEKINFFLFFSTILPEFYRTFSPVRKQPGLKVGGFNPVTNRNNRPAFSTSEHMPKSILNILKSACLNRKK
jgi:hypothetical protein